MPALISIPVTVRHCGRATIPDTKVTNVVNVGAVKHGRKWHSSWYQDAGNVSVRSINEQPFREGNYSLMLLLVDTSTPSHSGQPVRRHPNEPQNGESRAPPGQPKTHKIGGWSGGR